MVNSNDEMDIEIEDVGGIGSSKKDKISFKTICLEQYRLCAVEGSKEMTLGGVRKRFINGMMIEEIVPNQIEIFVNSVDILKHLLFPYIQIHSGKFATPINKFEDDLVKAEKEKDKLLEAVSKAFSKTSGERPPYGEPSERQLQRPMKNHRVLAVNRDYEHNRYVLYKELFGTLSFLLNKIGYFDELAG